MQLLPQIEEQVPQTAAAAPVDWRDEEDPDYDPSDAENKYGRKIPSGYLPPSTPAPIVDDPLSWLKKPEVEPEKDWRDIEEGPVYDSTQEYENPLVRTERAAKDVRDMTVLNQESVVQAAQDAQATATASTGRPRHLGQLV